jgi:hypothetical protein
MSRKYSAQEISRQSFHDSSVQGITWEANGQDLTIGLLWLPPKDSLGSVPSETTRVRLYFEYTTDLLVNFEFKGSMGMPSIYEMRLSPLPRDRWKVEIDFLGYPEGEMAFECNDISMDLEG